MNNDATLRLVRAVAIGFAILSGAVGALLFLQYAGSDGLSGFDILRATLIVMATSWIGWGAAQGFLGLMQPKPKPRWSTAPIESQTVVIVPVYNEDPRATFARIAAMDMSIAAQGLAEHVDFAILSDTTNPKIALAEREQLAWLLQRRHAAGRIFYRRREDNTGKKAGNIEDFVKRSGAAYDFALILDADSLMDGTTVGEMIRRMQAEPHLGLLQSLPRVVNARSVFGRAMQFSSAMFAPVFTRGLARLQGHAGPFWGHNAMVRMSAFAESCGLPELEGSPPFGGHILSHDYVEAALLARNGWTVRVDPDLNGSFEEGPENIIGFAKRDRRWCQGNLQHSRIIGAPGLRGWNRFTFAQGILSYVAPLLWGLFLVASIIATVTNGGPNYFPDPYMPFPVFPSDRTAQAIGLFAGVVGLLILPKLLIGIASAVGSDARSFGGPVVLIHSIVVEIILTSILAPIMMMFQSRSVFQVLMRADGGWPAADRDDGRLSFKEAWTGSWWITLTGALGLAVTLLLAPELTLWVLPVAGPMLIAPWLITVTSYPSQDLQVFRAPEETETPDIVALYHALRQEPLVFSEVSGDLKAFQPAE
ncbi:glucans biosynthesis glucosyltransferase MdoH [Qingshengfaniella alkalisoli]|uniref:glucans biosynthesis glucosyltransferase MdoH n=1 Tax=Qingshengfaniella alkalisoli TaxID=2599296 RepID=UPI001F0D451B|nr:glucans biosynthesis glucosyltransferase MdoH [Qingshengfaniella alkalisoli]